VKYLEVCLTTQSPLTIRADHAAGGTQTIEYIPGTTIMGSLASTFLMLYPEQKTTFEQLFLNDNVQFPCLYPVASQEIPIVRRKHYTVNDEKNTAQLPVYPFPKTALTCKRHKGFRPRTGEESEDDDGHGIRDTLITRALFAEYLADNDDSTDKAQGTTIGAQLDKERAALKILSELKQCDVCHEPTDRITGYYQQLASDSSRMRVCKVHTYTQTHTGINRQSGTVEEGILYSRQVINEGTQFWGLLACNDNDTYTKLQGLILEIGTTGLLRIGTGRSRGMGKVHITLHDSVEQQGSLEQFTRRLNALNKKLKQASQAYTELKRMQDYYYFSLTLHAPTILQDELLRYRGSIDANVLLQLLRELDDQLAEDMNLHCIYQQASIRRITGWQELWGTPRTNEYAIETGSVFIFKCPLAQRDALLPTLYHLEETGIGKRRAEGFGRIRISDEFHQEVPWR
jgi:Uncharacterized protein predicted to be involved in DNA repair (RAMP superfamily)